MAEQINIFVENKPGRLKTITRVLAGQNINIRAIEIADRERFGIVKLLVDDPHKGQRVLAENNFACALKKVLAIAIDDRPGGLSRLTETLSDNEININDAYGFVIASKKEAVLCVEVVDYDRATQIIEKNGFRILTDSELYDL